MPNGFSGNAARSYLTQASRAQENAQDATRQAQGDIPTNTRGALQRMRQLPFDPEDANHGQFSTGRGDSSNLVADQLEYNEIANSISKMDDAMGYCVHQTATEIEQLCQTIFVMPGTAARCQDISQEVKNLLRMYAEISNDLLTATRNFAYDITEV